MTFGSDNVDQIDVHDVSVLSYFDGCLPFAKLLHCCYFSNDALLLQGKMEGVGVNVGVTRRVFFRQKQMSPPLCSLELYLL